MNVGWSQVLKSRFWLWVGVIATCWVVGTASAEAFGWWGFFTLVTVPFIVEFWEWLHEKVVLSG